MADVQQLVNDLAYELGRCVHTLEAITATLGEGATTNEPRPSGKAEFGNDTPGGMYEVGR